MDKIYIQPDNKKIYYFDCTRINNSNQIVSRKGLSLDKQIENLALMIQDKEIILADDVVFSGNVLKKIISKFRGVGIQVIGVISSVCTEEAFDYFNLVLPLGIRCNYLLMNDVIDQICERDFYFGIAGSGIMVKTDNGFCKAPYFKPYGNPNIRASIPIDSVDAFSIGCLDRSISLWKDAEKDKYMKLKMSDLPEKIINTNKDDEVVKTLKKVRNNI